MKIIFNSCKYATPFYTVHLLRHSCDLPKSFCCGSMDPCFTLKGLRSRRPSSDMTLNHLDIHPTKTAEIKPVWSAVRVPHMSVGNREDNQEGVITIKSDKSFVAVYDPITDLHQLPCPIVEIVVRTLKCREHRSANQYY